MSKYIRLTTLTEAGKEQIENSTERTERLRELAAETDGTIEEVYLTFGDYDFVTIADFPDDRSYETFALKAAETGNFECQTLTALEESEYGSVVEEL